MDLKSALNRAMSRLRMYGRSSAQDGVNIGSEHMRMKRLPEAECPSAVADGHPMLQVGHTDGEHGRRPLGTSVTERSLIETMLQHAVLRRQRFAPELRDLDLNPVRYLLRRQARWPLERILLAEDEFLEFLAAIRRNPAQPLAPTAEADLFWHSLLLIGPLYAAVCDRVFGGKLLLHDPFHSFARRSGRPTSSPTLPQC